MSINFSDSKTKVNLMKAFAGESQARSRYTMAAAKAKKEKLAVVEKVFLFTADQEYQHAKLFYNKLSELCGESITIQSDFPINTYEKTLDQLKSAANGEYDEYEKAYPLFADEAKEEGFNEISKLFSDIAIIEKVHGDRFSKITNLLENGLLFKSENDEQRWICLNCGSIHIGKFAPEICEVCKHAQGYFARQDWILI